MKPEQHQPRHGTALAHDLFPKVQIEREEHPLLGNGHVDPMNVGLASAFFRRPYHVMAMLAHPLDQRSVHVLVGKHTQRGRPYITIR